MFTTFGAAIAIAGMIFLYFAGESALGDNATAADIFRGVVRAFIGLGAGALAGYLFRQASAQQTRFQNSRSAEVRIGSLDAFLAQFENGDAQNIRRGVGKRVYIDGELGEIDKASMETSFERSGHRVEDVDSGIELGESADGLD